MVATMKLNYKDLLTLVKLNVAGSAIVLRASIVHCIKYTRIRVSIDLYFPMVDSVLIRTNTAQRKPVLSYILCSDRITFFIDIALLNAMSLRCFTTKWRYLNQYFP